jgi:AraC family ethanolamine operon transcriptional activator
MTMISESAQISAKQARYLDIDLQAAQLSGFDQVYRQLSCGAFKGSFLSVATSTGAGLHTETVNQVIEQVCATPSGLLSLIFLRDAQGPARIGRSAFAFGDVMLLGPGAEVDGQTMQQTKICVMTAGLRRLEALIPTLALADLAKGGSLTIHSKSLAERLSKVARAIDDTAFSPDRPQTALSSRKITAAIELAFADAMRWPREQDDGVDSVGVGQRWTLFQSARAMIHEDIDGVTVDELLLRLNVSRRTLEYVFRDCARLSPHAYITALRLDAIRRELLDSEDTIGDVAARHGIWHLSRLAARFRAQFGFLPSETKKRS